VPPGWLGCGVTVAEGTGDGATGVCVAVGRTWTLVPPSSVELTASSSALPVASGLWAGTPSGLCDCDGDGGSF
jgi:hypothetical protein